MSTKFTKCRAWTRKISALRKILWSAFATTPFLFSGEAQAQTTFVWDNQSGDFSWGNSTNWNPDGTPGILDTATFSSTTVGTIDLGGGSQSIAVINFTANSTSNYTLSNGTLSDVVRINQTADDPNVLTANASIITAGAGTGILTSNVTANTLQLQGRVTAGGIIKTGGGTLRLGTSGTAFNGGIAGDIVINGGTLQVSAGNTDGVNNPMASSGGTGAYTINAGDDVIIGASGVTFSTTHSNVASGSGGTYDWQRNIIAGNNSFSWTADRAAGSANAGTAVIGTISIGNATLRNDTGNGFSQRTDGLILDAGATTTVQTDDLLMVDSLVADASSKLIKTGGSELRIMSSLANSNATSFLGDIDLVQGTLTLFSNAAGEDPLGNANTLISIIHPTNNPTVSLRGAAATVFNNSNIAAGNNNFQLDVRNSSGSTNGFTMTASSVSLGNATMTVTGDRANARITSLGLDAGSTLSTINVNSNSNTAQSLRIDNLSGTAGNVLRKTGGQAMFISAHAGAYAGALELGGGTVQVEINAGSDLNPLANASRVTFISGSTLNLRSEATYTFDTPVNFDANTISSTINVDRLSGSLTGQRITVGKIDLSQASANPKTLTVTQGNSFTLGTPEIAVAAGTATLNNGADVFTPKLSVAAGSTFIKIGGSQLTLTGDQTASILGAVELRAGTMTGSGAGYLGGQGILVGNTIPITAGFNNDTSRLRFTVTGASSASGVGATAMLGGVIDLDATPTATDKFAVLTHGRIQGNTAQLAALTVGTNLTIANDSIIMHETPSAANNGNTVTGLTNDMSLYYGLANNATSLPAIGVGTPWKGISGDISARTIQGSAVASPALININGGDNNPDTVEAYLQAMNGNINLNIGTATASDASVNFVSTAAGGEKVTLGIRGYLGTTTVGMGKGGTVAFNDPATQTNIAAAVDKIIVEGSLLTLTTPQTLGGVPIDVVGNGVLDIANAAGDFIDGNVVIKDGGALVLNDNQPLEGSGSITISTGGKLDIVGNPKGDILTGGGGTQVINFASTGNNTVRFSAENITGLDAAVPDPGATWVVSGGAATTGPLADNFGSTNLQDLVVNTQTEGLSTNGGVITNDGTSRGLNAPLTIGANGVTIAATRGTNFVIGNAVVTTGNVQVGSLTAIDGRDKSNNSAALNSIGIPDPYNSGAAVYFGSDFAANNVVVNNSQAYFLDPDTAIQGTLSITNGVLYLDGGGNISGTQGQLTPKLAAGTLAAGGIFLGSNTRNEMKLDSPPSGRLDINQAYVIDGDVNPVDNRRFWVSRNSGTSALGVNFNNVVMNAGSALAVDEDNTDVRMNLTLKGDVSIFIGSANDATDFINLVRDSSAPATVTVAAGRINQTTGIQNFNAGTSSVFGTIGAGININLIRSTYQLMPGATLDGNIFTQNAPVGGDAFVISSSNGSTSDTTIGGTGRIELGRSAASNGPEDFEVRGTEVGSGTAPLHTHSGLIRVVDDGISTNLDGIVRSNRANDTTVTARTAVSNVQVASGAGIQYSTLNGSVLRVDTTTLQGNGTIDVATAGVTLGTIDAGNNNVVLQGASTPTITNPIIAKDLAVNGLAITLPATGITGNISVGTNPGGAVSSGTTGTTANVTLIGDIVGSLSGTGSTVSAANVGTTVTLANSTANLTGNIGGAVTMNSSVLNLNAGGGVRTIGGPVAVGLGAVNVSNGTWDAGTNLITGSGEQIVAGLRENRTSGSFDVTTPNTSTAVKLGPVQAQTTGGWGTNETYTYTGEFFVPNNNGDGTGTFAFAENFDDSVRLTINGTQLLNNTVWNVPSASGAVTLPSGWYPFEARFGQGTGGAGPNTNGGWDATLAFGIDLTDPVDGNTVRANYSAPLDNGSMNMFRTAIGSSLNVAANSAIKAGGITNISDINFIGSNPQVQLVANGTPTTSTVGALNLATGSTSTLQVDEAGDNLNVAKMNLGGSLTLSGAGGLTVSGAGSGTAALSSNIAKLINNGSITGPTTVSAGTVGGIGTFAALDLTGTSTLSPGNSPGTLTTGDLSLTADTISLFELNPGNTIPGGGINDLVIVNGNLSLDGTLQINQVGAGSLNGSYVLFDYSGTLTDNGLGIDPLFLAANPSAEIVIDPINTQVLLTVTAVPEPSTIVLGSLFGLGLLAHRLRKRRRGC